MGEKGYKNTRKYLGHLIHQHRREKKNISADILANITNLDANNLRRIEGGKGLPKLATMIKIIDALDIDPQEFQKEIIKHILKDEQDK